MGHTLDKANTGLRLAKLSCAVTSGVLVWLLTLTGSVGIADAGQSHFPNEAVASYEAPDSPDANFKELTGFHFVLDPGHGGTCNTNCYGAQGPRLTYEKYWTLRIAQDMQSTLSGQSGHGAQVHLTRTCDCDVTLDRRVYLNNNWYDQEGGTSNNWRLISIHLNASGDPGTNYTSTWYRLQTPNQQSLELAQASSRQIGRVTLLNSYAYTEDLQMTRETKPVGYNILTESCFLTNATCENNLQDNGFEYPLAYSHYRSLVDYWLVGYTGPHQNFKSDIYNSYWDNINNGIIMTPRN
jgi:N-acetylmuramoyl-L-alanine amidase